MKLAYKAWIEKDGYPVFGNGIYKLLKLVHDTGSLHKAAEALHMSYRAAWGKLRTFEGILNRELLCKGRHGRTGAQLTETGHQMMVYFERLRKEIDRSQTEGPLRQILNEMKAYLEPEIESRSGK
jgi:molybdate transport system regulatory protein